MQVYGDGESVPELIREPEMENAGGKKTYYDSVQVIYIYIYTTLFTAKSHSIIQINNK